MKTKPKKLKPKCTAQMELPFDGDRTEVKESPLIRFPKRVIVSPADFHVGSEFVTDPAERRTRFNAEKEPDPDGVVLAATRSSRSSTLLGDYSPLVRLVEARSAYGGPEKLGRPSEPEKPHFSKYAPLRGTLPRTNRNNGDVF